MSKLLCKDFPEKSLPRNANWQAKACLFAFQVLNVLEVELRITCAQSRVLPGSAHNFGAGLFFNIINY